MIWPKLIITLPQPPLPTNDPHPSGREHDVVGQSLRLSERSKAHQAKKFIGPEAVGGTCADSPAGPVITGAAQGTMGAVALAIGVTGGDEVALQRRYQHRDQGVMHDPIT